MLAVPVFDAHGRRVGERQVDPLLLGGLVNAQLLKQAIVTFDDHQRWESARRKGRSDVEGSTRKLFRQKGTGNARMGAIRTCVRRGGGRAFAKRGPRRFKEISKKMRRLARNHAVLAKLKSEQVLVVNHLEYAEPKTRPLMELLVALGADKGCLLATNGVDRNVYRSGRNIAKTTVCPVDELNAREVLLRDKLIFTGPALDRFLVVAAEAGGGSAIKADS